MKKSKFTETKIVLILKQAHNWCTGERHLPPDGYQHTDALSVEVEIRRHGRRTSVRSCRLN